MAIEARRSGKCPACELPIKRGALIQNLDGQWVHLHHVPPDQRGRRIWHERKERPGNIGEQLDALIQDLREEFLDLDDFDSDLDVERIDMGVKVCDLHTDKAFLSITSLSVDFNDGTYVDGDELNERRPDLWADAVDLLKEQFLVGFDGSYTEGGVCWP